MLRSLIACLTTWLHLPWIHFRFVVLFLVAGQSTPQDELDWHVANASTGDIFSSGYSVMETPSLSTSVSGARVLALGRDMGGVTGSLISPVWLHPAQAASVRSSVPTNIKIAVEVPGSASSWVSVNLEFFENGTQGVLLNGEAEVVRTIVASDAMGSYRLTLARTGSSRLILALVTPYSQSEVTAIQTPSEFRLRGHIVRKTQVNSVSKVPGFTDGFTTFTGISNAEVFSSLSLVCSLL